ncbi:MAG: indole-3-glycerol phosphate synthase TrpC [Lachnospiraceae bacterium]|nr:indole-3-glycerol phosphate synthase TrpC [Lachnospiraceae bacterium]
MILDDLKNATQRRVEEQKKRVSPRELQRRIEQLPKASLRKNFLFEETVKTPGLHYICEVKKASPSKGVIAEDFPYMEIAREYEEAGASAISVLTEPEYFKGELRYLEEIRHEVRIPILRKDFTCDEYMIQEAKLCGADCVLLIAAMLTEKEMCRFREKADELGLSSLFEAHDAEEVKACLNAGARIVGVNNRNLKTFEVDIECCAKLRALVPPEVVFVAESGIKTAEEIKRLKEIGANACLVGETLMRAPDKKAKLLELDNMK